MKTLLYILLLLPSICFGQIEFQSSTGSGSGSQTPWTSDINANQKSLTNLANMSLSGSGPGSIKLYDTAATEYAGWIAPSDVTTSYQFEFPAAIGTAGYLYAAVTSGGKSVVTLGAGGGSQTPWTANVNADSFSLTNATSITLLNGASNANVIASSTNAGYGLNFANNSVNIAWGGTNIASFTNGTLMLHGTGSANYPLIGFSGDSDGTGSGLWRSSANRIDMSINGVSSWYSDTSGFNIGGSLYIGPATILTSETTATLQIGTDNNPPVNQTFKGPDGSGANFAGGHLTLGAGRATGTGAVGQIHFAVGTNGTASSSSQNLHTNVVSISSTTSGLTYTNRAVFWVQTNDFVIGTRYTNSVVGGFSFQRAMIMASFTLNAAAAGTAKVTVYAENNGGKTNMLSVSAGPLASLVTVEPLVMMVDPGAAFTFVDETSGSGASVAIVARTSSYFGQ